MSITVSANPPRSVFLDLPLGHTSGLPDDPDGQRTILSQALAAGVAMTGPGIHELDYRFIDDDWKAHPLSWSRKRQTGNPARTAGGDSRTGRSSRPVFQNDADAAAAADVNWDDQCLVCLGIPAPG
jgi:hypothetical protein